MRVLIRTDSSSFIGGGHLVRCLRLARKLREVGASVTVATRELPGNISYLVRDNHFPLMQMPDNSGEGANLAVEDLYSEKQLAGEIQYFSDKFRKGDKFNLIVVDHYGLSIKWDSELKKFCPCLMVIDDLAQQRRNCDILLNANMLPDLEIKYRDKVSDSTLLLCGTKYQLLNYSPFPPAEMPCAELLSRPRVAAFLGTGVSNRVAPAVIQALSETEIARVDVLMGNSDSNSSVMQAPFKSGAELVVHHSVSFESLLTGATLAITSGGLSVWEAIAKSLPVLAISCSHNQRVLCEGLFASGVIDYLGTAEAVSGKEIKTAVARMISNPSLREQLASVGFKLCDGCGTERVVSEILKKLKT